MPLTGRNRWANAGTRIQLEPPTADTENDTSRLYTMKVDAADTAMTMIWRIATVRAAWQPARRSFTTGARKNKRGEPASMATTLAIKVLAFSA